MGQRGSRWANEEAAAATQMGPEGGWTEATVCLAMNIERQMFSQYRR